MHKSSKKLHLKSLETHKFRLDREIKAKSPGGQASAKYNEAEMEVKNRQLNGLVYMIAEEKSRLSRKRAKNSRADRKLKLKKSN